MLDVLTKSLQIEASIILHLSHGSKSLFKPLHRRTALSALRVKDTDADLKENAHESELIANRLEEEFFEPVAGLIEIAGLKMRDGQSEARIVFDWDGLIGRLHQTTGRLPAPSRDTHDLGA